MRVLALLSTTLLLQTPAAKPPVGVTPMATGVAVMVTVRPQSDVAGPKLTLADIAEVSGSDKALAERVSAVEIGAAPLIGLSRTLMKADIITRLRFNKIDPASVEVVSSPTFKVTRTGADVAVPEITEFALNALKGARKGADEVSIEAIPTPFRWVVPSGKRELQAGAPHGGVDGGTAFVPVTILVDGKPAKTVEIAFKVKRLGAVLVATRQLEPHTTIKAEDVSLTTQEAVPGGVALSDPALAIGMRTTRLILAGSVLTKGMVEATPIIAIGTQVEVQVVIGGITVAASGVARSPGAAGDRIRVFVGKTNKEISATVIDAKTVRMEENG
jgi:flagella basal body P-ring formation protein FlgA